MNRLEKKCYIAATGFHLSLLLILLIGPAFLSSEPKPSDTQAITMIDLSKLTDGPTQTGGPLSAPPPPTPPQPLPPTPTPPTPEPPAPEPPKKSLVEKIFEPDPPKDPPTVKDDPDGIETTKKKIVKTVNSDPGDTKPKKPAIEVTKKLVKRTSNNKTTKTTTPAPDDSEARATAARQARATAISRVLGNLENGLSSGTEVSIPGPGAGTFVNYAEAVKRVYTDAWIPPTDATDDNATAKVSVTIARDGNVVSARVKTPSGSAPVDRSVEQTLRRVKFVAPFPAGATDAERTFIILFNLKAKRSLG